MLTVAGSPFGARPSSRGRGSWAIRLSRRSGHHSLSRGKRRNSWEAEHRGAARLPPLSVLVAARAQNRVRRGSSRCCATRGDRPACAATSEWHLLRINAVGCDQTQITHVRHAYIAYLVRQFLNRFLPILSAVPKDDKQKLLDFYGPGAEELHNSSEPIRAVDDSCLSGSVTDEMS
jgi:hypothetical protein